MIDTHHHCPDYPQPDSAPQPLTGIIMIYSIPYGLVLWSMLPAITTADCVVPEILHQSQLSIKKKCAIILNIISHIESVFAYTG